MASRARRLAAQLRDLRDAAAAFPDALALLDDAGRVRWINRAAERLLGLHWPRDRGASLAERMQGSKLGDWLSSGQERADDIPAPANGDIRINASLIAFGQGQRVLRARDITELARLDQVRRDFVANVSHELRTPLTVIHGYLELLDPEEVPALAPVITEMRTQSRRMGQIVEDLLTLSRLEMKRSLQDEHVATAPMFATIR
ncbi:MAG TPA: histidine kinase dimerization/phospho-acceptor domain-containing protein, partial [Rudaea sp.]|nr:histidine kinase dimerization/phospho-acceptor domain-containing protein [Rudaea sp.]